MWARAVYLCVEDRGAPGCVLIPFCNSCPNSNKRMPANTAGASCHSLCSPARGWNSIKSLHCGAGAYNIFRTDDSVEKTRPLDHTKTKWLFSGVYLSLKLGVLLFKGEQKNWLDIRLPTQNWLWPETWSDSSSIVYSLSQPSPKSHTNMTVQAQSVQWSNVYTNSVVIWIISFSAWPRHSGRVSVCQGAVTLKRLMSVEYGGQCLSSPS